MNDRIIARFRQAGINLTQDQEATVEEVVSNLVALAVLRARADIVQIAVAVRRSGGPNAADIQNMNEIITRGVIPGDRGN